MNDNKTFTGKPLEQMTLEQKLLEVQDDWITLQGLRNGFMWGLRNVGINYALKNTALKYQLKSTGKLAEAISDYERQIEEDKSAIEADSNAWVTGSYREQKQADAVKNVFDRLNESGDQKAYKDSRRFIKEHLEAIAAEKRRLNLDEKFPEETIGKKVGRISNFLKDNAGIIVPITLAFTLGGGSCIAANNYVESRNRNRPTHTVMQVVDTDHPGVESAALTNDTAMRSNRLVNSYLNGRGNNFVENHNRIIELVQKTRRANNEAEVYYNPIKPAVSDLFNGGNKIGDAWSHSSYESTHIERDCSTTTDSEGKSQTTCTNRVVCDYVDHTWRFYPHVAESGIQLFTQGLTEIEGNMPEAIDVSNIESNIRNYVQKRYTRYTNLEEQERRYKQMNDFIGSITIAGNNELITRLSSMQASAENGRFAWIRNNRHHFPLVHSDRDYMCGSGSAPQGYYVSQQFESETMDLIMHYTEMRDGLESSRLHLNNIENTLLRLNSTIQNNGSSSDIGDLYEEFGEGAIALQKDLNPHSNYSLLSKGWRIAIPLMFLFGLGGLGAVGGYLGVKNFGDKKYNQRMYQHGMK